MNLSISKSKLQSAIEEKGFLHIKFPQSRNVQNILTSLGEVIQQTEVRENPKSTRLLASSHEMGLHTDHHAAKYIAWFCNSQASSGGRSILLDTQKVFLQFSEHSISLLQEVTVKTHQVFYSDKLSIPLLTIQENAHSVYYAQWLVNNPGTEQHQKALARFEEEIMAVNPIQLLLSEGDMLIIDNHRMLHGREAFPEKSNRWLTRYWIKQTQY